MGSTKAVAQSFVVIDLETTDLPRLGETVKITELAMQSFSRSCLITMNPGSALLPRVSNQMLFCLNPCKTIHPKAAEITGLTNEGLCTEKKFDKGLCLLINHFLERLPQPVCLVAHNGLAFDFPILQAELSMVGETLCKGLLVLDSLHAFKDMIPRRSRSDQLTSFAINQPPCKKQKTAAVLTTHKLDDLHKFLVTIKKREDTHSAFGDVSALTKCIFARPQSFLMWADAKVVEFSTVKKMW